MHKKFQKGFTLIELLVVIAIIGILASIVLVSLNSARGKGRDAKRVAELGQIARVVSVADTGTAVSLGCGTAAAGLAITACTLSNLNQFSDPSSATVCANLLSAQAATCQYTVTDEQGVGTNAATTQNWRVKTSLENAAGSLNAGGTCISSATSTPFQGKGCNS